MQEIASILSGQMNHSLMNKTAKPAVAEGFSFLDVARSLVASQIAVTEKGSMEEMNLRKKEEVNLDLLKLENEEEEDIFDLIKRFQNVLKDFKGT